MDELNTETYLDNKACTNCGHISSEKYCSHCGQRKTVQRITFKSILEEIASSVIGLNGKLPRTFIDLFKQPGKVVKSVIAGNRVQYMSPPNYYFLLFALLLLYTSLLNVDLAVLGNTGDFNQLFGQDPEKMTDQIKEMQSKLNEWIFGSFQYVTLLKFIFYAVCARWFYKDSGFNFMEHLVFGFYVSAQSFLILFFSLTTYKLTGNIYNLFWGSLSVLYFIWVTMQVYGYKNKFRGFLKALLFNIVSNMLFFIVFMIIIFGILILTFSA
jgi:hypothetical protein